MSLCSFGIFMCRFLGLLSASQRATKHVIYHDVTRLPVDVANVHR